MERLSARLVCLPVCSRNSVRLTSSGFRVGPAACRRSQRWSATHTPQKAYGCRRPTGGGPPWPGSSTGRIEAMPFSRSGRDGRRLACSEPNSSSCSVPSAVSSRAFTSAHVLDLISGSSAWAIHTARTQATARCLFVPDSFRSGSLARCGSSWLSQICKFRNITNRFPPQAPAPRVASPSGGTSTQAPRCLPLPNSLAPSAGSGGAFHCCSPVYTIQTADLGVALGCVAEAPRPR